MSRVAILARLLHRPHGLPADAPIWQWLPDQEAAMLRDLARIRALPELRDAA